MPNVLRSRPALFLALLLAACDQNSSGPRSALPIQFSRQVTLPAVQSQLVTGPARVEVSVVPGTLTARRVVIEQSDQLTRPERVRSRVTAIPAGTEPATPTRASGRHHAA